MGEDIKQELWTNRVRGRGLLGILIFVASFLRDDLAYIYIFRCMWPTLIWNSQTPCFTWDSRYEWIMPIHSARSLPYKVNPKSRLKKGKWNKTKTCLSGLAAGTPAVLTSQETEERKARRLLEHGQHTETCLRHTPINKQEDLNKQVSMKCDL